MFLSVKKRTLLNSFLFLLNSWHCWFTPNWIKRRHIFSKTQVKSKRKKGHSRIFALICWSIRIILRAKLIVVYLEDWQSNKLIYIRDMTLLDGLYYFVACFYLLISSMDILWFDMCAIYCIWFNWPHPLVHLTPSMC